MQRFSIRKIYEQLKIKEIANPLASMLGLCMLYNLVYLLSLFVPYVMALYAIEVVMGLASSVGFYWICLQCWNQEKMKKEAVVRVLFLETIYLLIVLGILPGITNYVSTDNVVIQVIGALVAIGMIPMELIYFFALSKEIYDTKEIFAFIKNIMKRHSRSIFNVFCMGFIFIFFLDSIMGGMFSLVSGIDTTTIAKTVLLYGNPMLAGVMMLSSSLLFGYSALAALGYSLLYFVIGLWYGVIEVNYILYIQRKCLDDGTSKNTTNKKKNRITK